ncbi:MAG: Fe-S cluster assembly protein SufD [Gammaproteobacteria bacterium]|nr:Fe-S cluster assembly protein SufD [Gammaproteobacteria bacterium]
MKSAASISIPALRDAILKMPQDALTKTRLAALEHLDEHGTPTIRHEDWKYTDLAPLIDISNEWLAAGAHTERADSIASTIADVQSRFDADWLVVINGTIDMASVATVQAAGINVALLSETEPTLHFTAPLSDLNVSLLRDGLRIHVDAGVTLEKPVGILVIDSASSTVGVAQVHVEIEMAPGSDAGFLEYHASSGSASHYANSVVRLAIGDNAAARYVRLQDRSPAHSQTGRLDAQLGRCGRLSYCGFDLGGKLVRNDLSVQLDKPGAEASFDGLYLAGGQQHIDNHTRVDHLVGPATSRQEYRGILGGSSRCVWNGKAVVHVGADGTDAEQANHNLLLSDSAEVDAKPELEIYADEVKCSHGTTIGQLDETALFYLRTRGLDRREAKQIMTRAFAQSIVRKAPIESLQNAIAEQVATKLDALGDGDMQ